MDGGLARWADRMVKAKRTPAAATKRSATSNHGVERIPIARQISAVHPARVPNITGNSSRNGCHQLSRFRGLRFCGTPYPKSRLATREHLLDPRRRLPRALRILDPNIKVIGTSGNSDDQRSAEMKGLGLAAFLNKPYDKHTLLMTLHQVLHFPQS